MRRKPTMQLVRNNVGRAELAIALALLVLFLFAWTAGPAFAGADTTFDTALNTFTDFLEGRSEEHTSELQSLMRISYAVFCLKKKNKQKPHNTHVTNIYYHTTTTNPTAT